MLVYLDNSATTRQYDEVTELMSRAMRENFGNPSSLHSLGLKAEKEVKNARKILAQSLGADEEEVFFTSCGTESDNTVLMGAAQAKKRRGKKIIVSAVEHPAILEPAKKLESMGFEVAYIGVDKQCRLNLESLKNAVTDDTILISVMGVNNETGTIMPIEEIARFKEEYNRTHGTDIWLHTDAVQAFGKILVNLKKEYKGVDFLSASAHKIHGPKGMGLLYMKKGLNLGKSVSDIGWGKFTQILEELCNKLGKLLIRVDRWYPSSKTCSHCGYINNDLKLEDRVYVCPECRHVMSRDKNAATNILKESFRILEENMFRPAVERYKKPSLLTTIA